MYKTGTGDWACDDCPPGSSTDVTGSVSANACAGEFWHEPSCLHWHDTQLLLVPMVPRADSSGADISLQWDRPLFTLIHPSSELIRKAKEGQGRVGCNFFNKPQLATPCHDYIEATYLTQ